MPKNQKCLEKVTQFSENFVFFRHFILMFLSYFWTKLRKKIICFTKILCFIHFLCIGIALVPQKTLIPKVILLTVGKNPGLQPDTASYLNSYHNFLSCFRPHRPTSGQASVELHNYTIIIFQSKVILTMVVDLKILKKVYSTLLV